jgi:hypothetical protein
MAGFEPIEWLAMLAVGAGCAIGLLHIAAVRIRNDREMAELFDRAMALRRRHEERIAALRGGVHLVGEAPEEAIVVDAAPEQPAREAA